MRTTVKTIQSIQKKLNEATREALELIEERARKILRQRGGEFVMCMGSFFFKDRHGEIIHGDSQGNLPSWQKPVAQIVDEFDSRLGLTGTPMRFTADGPRVTDW